MAIVPLPVPQNYAGILVASADAGLRDQIVATLNTNRWPVMTAHGGADALGKLESSECDVLLLDRRLPDLEADELIETIRQQFSSSQVDKRKVGKLSEAIEGAFQELGAFSSANRLVGSHIQERAIVNPREHPPVAVPDQGRAAYDRPIKDGAPDLDEMKRLKGELEQSLVAEIERKEVSIRLGPEGLVLSLREIGFFSSGSAHIRPEAQPAIDRIAAVLNERPCRLRIEGHTDNVPIHNGHFASNWELSTARATEVVRSFVTQHGFPPANLAAAGYAEFHPAAGNETEDGRRINRRVDVIVLPVNDQVRPL